MKKNKELLPHRHHIIPDHAWPAGFDGYDDPSNTTTVPCDIHAEMHRLRYQLYNDAGDLSACKLLRYQPTRDEHTARIKKGIAQMSPEAKQAMYDNQSKASHDTHSAEHNAAVSKALTTYMWIGTNIKTGEVIRFRGYKELTSTGFSASHVHSCCTGKRKRHKGHTWTKELLSRSGG